jgi:outer membrane protein
MRRIITLLVGLFVANVALAQQTEQAAESFTLEQCIQYALENSIAAKNADLDQRIAKAKVNETVGIGLPQISGTGSVVHNQTLQRFFAYYPTAQGFGGVNADGTPKIDIPGLGAKDVVALQSPFQLKSSGIASATVNQMLFNGSYLVGLKASNTYKELSVKTALQTDQDIIQQVTKAYYGVLINKERKALFDDNIARVDSLLRNTTLLNQNGFAESIDVDRVKVTLNNLRSERDKFLNLEILGIQLLKFQMNYPPEKGLDVIGSIQDMEVTTSLDSYKEGFDYKNRPDYQVLEVNRKLQALNVKNMYAANLPTLSAFATLGYSTQSPTVGGIFKTNSSFKSGDYPGIGPDAWYQYSQYGINLNVPIFSGLQRHYRTQQEKLKLIQTDNQFIRLKRSIDFEITQATISFDNAMKTLVAQKANQDLAANIARVTKVKYEQGVGSSLEVTDAENSLRTAQTNYYSALFDAMVAKVDIDKAYGKLLPANQSLNSQPENK